MRWLLPAAAREHSGILEAYREGVERDLSGQALDDRRSQPAAQLELVLELIVGRISSDSAAGHRY